MANAQLEGSHPVVKPVGLRVFPEVRAMRQFRQIFPQLCLKVSFGPIEVPTGVFFLDVFFVSNDGTYGLCLDLCFNVFFPQKTPQSACDRGTMLEGHDS